MKEQTPARRIRTSSHFLSKIATGVKFMIIAIIVLSLSCISMGAPVTEQQVRATVQGWLQVDPTPLNEPLGASIQEVQTFKGEDGEAAYYIVYLDPTGFVIVPADDLVEPILGFARAGRYDPSVSNPLGTLVNRDTRARLAVARSLGLATPYGPFLAAQNKWNRLGANGPVGLDLGNGLASISDVRVPPLIQSHWDQTTNLSGAACYNYFTPPYGAGVSSNFPCGCVATAMAQLMRYYCYPTSGVGTQSFVIYISYDGGHVYSAFTNNLLGGDMNGGPYVWTNMPLIPSGVVPDECQAIGRLTYDAGVAVGMGYASTGSKAWMIDAAKQLTNTFHFEQTRFGHETNRNSDISAYLPTMVNPNLDAKYPVLLALGQDTADLNNSEGHAVVCDGYGYESGTNYYHLNLGWAGLCDAWYNLPDVQTIGHHFQVVQDCIYNIFTNGNGEIISGRVVEQMGPNTLPVPDVTVTAVYGSTITNTVTLTATTDTNGIYAFARIPPNTQYWLTAAKPGYVAGNSMVTNTSSSVFNSLTCGNVWGADFTLNRAPSPYLYSCTFTGAIGNSNSAIDPGETIEETVVLGNNANGQLVGVSALLSTTTTGVTVLVSNADYPDIAPGELATNAAPFKYRVAKSVPCGTRITFTLVAAPTNGPPSINDFSHTVGLLSGTGYGEFESSQHRLFSPSRPCHSIITVPGSSLVVADVDVHVRLDCTNLQDIEMTMSHGSMTVPLVLFGNCSGTNFGNGNCGFYGLVRTVFDDGMPWLPPLPGITNGTAPYLGNYCPALPLTNFNGTSSPGEWMVNVTTAGASGTLECWSLGILSEQYTCEMFNSAPIASNDVYSVNHNTTLTVSAPGVLGNDFDADEDLLTVAFNTSPAHGTLTLNANGSFTYKPATNYYGNDSFTYQVTDGWINCEATVNITVAQGYFYGFDTAAPSWIIWPSWGMQGWPLHWTNSLDASSNPSSGSLRYEVPFTGAAGEQIVTFGTLANCSHWDGSTIVDGTRYANLIISIRVDPGTAPTINGDYGTLDLGFTLDGWGQFHVADIHLPLAATNWMTFTNPINPAWPGVDKVNGIYLKIWSNGTWTNQFNFSVDNIWLQAIPTDVLPPPPVLSLEKADSGLHLISGFLGGAAARYSIYTTNPIYSWFNATTSVTYSVTINHYPGPDHQGFQTHMFIVPYYCSSNSMPPVTNMLNGPGDSAVDWTAGNCVCVQIQNGAGHTGIAKWMYKTNQFNGNSMFFSANGNLGTVISTTILGTWSMTFSHNTNVTLTAPDNSTTNFVLPPASAAMFNTGPMFAYFGIMPNSADNVGQSSVIGRVRITGGFAPDINDDFTTDTALQTSTWCVAAADTNGVQLVTTSMPFWLFWTLPDADFHVQSATTLTGSNTWSNSSLTNILHLDLRKRVLVPATLSATNAAFFRLRK